MSIAIIDYGSGNLRSAAKAFERSVADAGLSTPVVVTSDPEAVLSAERIVLPGVGAFADCRSGLHGLPGMVEALREVVLQNGRPFFGICVGMQLLARTGFENGEHEGLGWIAGDVRRLEPADKRLKVPHMGWNELSVTATEHPVLQGLAPGAHAYFVHSYHFVADAASSVLATTSYGGTVAAVVGRDNIVGTQFHPEKSQAVGLQLIRNFLTWHP